MKRPFRLICCVICSISFLISSCHKEVYDPSALERDYFIQDIPEGFDWSTLSSVNLEVMPYDQYDGQYFYTIEVFSQNPSLDESVILYTKGWCSAQKPLKKSVSLPSSQKVVYVRQTTPGGRKTVKEVEISNNTIRCNFAPESFIAPTTTKALLTKAQEIPDELPDEFEEIDYSRSENTLRKNTDYVLARDYTGKINFAPEGNCNLYVTAVWTNTGEDWSPTIIQNNSNLYLMDGGRILAKNSSCKFQFSNDAVLGIQKNAQLGEEGKNNVILQFGTKGVLINEGKLYGKGITAESRNMEITNKGIFYADKLSSGDSYNFYNECYTYIKEVEMPKGSRLEIAGDCCFAADKMTLKNASVTLGSAAMLDVDKMHTVDNGGQNTISGIGSQYALTRIKELSCEWSHRATVIFNANNIVACEKLPANRDLYKINTSEETSSGPTIEIKPSTCSKGNDYIPEQPVQPEFPRWEVYNQAYTFASEDNYPSPGDYDMNDIVIGLDSVAYYYVKDDDDESIGKMKLYLTLRAVGATRQLGAAIQFDELDQDEVKQVSYSQTLPLSNFKINGNGVEANQEHAVIPLFDNAHQVLGIENTSTIVNTISNKPEWITDASPVSFEVTIEFTSPVDEDDLEMEELNYFVIVGSRTDKRIEIHLPDKDHSDLSTTPGEEQFIAHKFMWTICIPGHFRYPHEWENIKNVYPDFEKWVHSKGEEYRSWYESPVENLLYKQ